MIGLDKKYKSGLVQEFINKVMLRGQKETAQKIIYDALNEVSQRTKKPAMEIFDVAMQNAFPLLEVRSRRIGGATYQVPMEVPDHRKIDLVFRWIVKICQTKKGKATFMILADEILAMYKNEGAVIKKREDLHKMAEANKAFAHFARY